MVLLMERPKGYQLSLSVNYIHAEKLVSVVPSEIHLQIQLALPAGQVHREDSRLVLPFTLTASTTPPILSITIKGLAEVRFEDEHLMEEMLRDIEKGKVPHPIFATVFQYCYFEVVLLSRELGLPPPIPAPAPPHTVKEKSTNVMQVM